MKFKNNRLSTLAICIAILLTSAPFTFAIDEGMYAPGQIASLPLKKKGLKIKPEEVYNPAGGGLTDAVIRLSIGCTAEFVSPEGLILTNHHCGFDALVAASTPEKDLVETGFKTDSRAGEIAAKDYSIFLTNRVEDVTAKIKSGTENLTGDALAAKIKSNTDALQAAEHAKAKAGATIRIQALNSGYFYYLYETQQINDIRVVYAPPRNIGVFGGDPDNFEWTRHTGDFTFLRAYVAPDGTSAEYSTNNVPYKPKKFLTANIGGLKENDFVFVLGYPGSTTRYRESWSVIYARDANFPFLERWLGAASDSLRAIGATDEEKRIAFQSDIANFDNSRKAFGGGHLQLKRVQAVQQRQADEARMAAWIAADPARQKKYGNVLAELKALSEESNAAQMRDVIMRRFPDPNAMAALGVMYTYASAVKSGRAIPAQQKAAIQESLKGRDATHEREMLKFFFKEFDNLPAGQRFAAADAKFENKKGKARRDAEAAFAALVADTTDAEINSVSSMSWSEIQSKHPFIAAVVDERAALSARSAKFAANIDRLRLLYMQAYTEMKGISPVYPDANSSLRFSYGYIKGFQSREAEYRMPFTTMKGMIEKETGVKPFDLPSKLVDLQNAKDFGRYGSGDSVVVNFLSTTDIIGGNSGSPILNARGEQVGLCFDGNFQGLGNDFYFDTEKNRTISVDIRYVLFVTEKFGGAKWVVDEMKLVGGKK
ncbi:MAG: S46 family peptidase [Pyrinomonadaceae bacterium]